MDSMPRVATNGGSLKRVIAETVEPTGRATDRDARHDGAGNRKFQTCVEGTERDAGFQQARRDGAGEAEDRADGEIDAAAEDDERHADEKAEDAPEISRRGCSSRCPA